MWAWLCLVGGRISEAGVSQPQSSVLRDIASLPNCRGGRGRQLCELKAGGARGSVVTQPLCSIFCQKSLFLDTTLAPPPSFLRVSHAFTVNFLANPQEEKLSQPLCRNTPKFRGLMHLSKVIGVTDAGSFRVLHPTVLRALFMVLHSGIFPGRGSGDCMGFQDQTWVICVQGKQSTSCNIVLVPDTGFELCPPGPKICVPGTGSIVLWLRSLL